MDKRLNQLKKESREAESVFPSSLIDYYLQCGGCETTDEHVKKLVSLELQQFIQEVLAEVKRAAPPQQKVKRVKKQDNDEQEEVTEVYSLDAEVLEKALLSKGITTSKAPYHLN